MFSPLFVTFLNEDDRPGYRNKIHAQVIAMSELEGVALLLIVKTNGFCLYHYANGEVVHSSVFSYNRKRIKAKRNALDELFSFKQFCDLVIRIVKDNSIDLIYIRRIVPITPRLLSLLKTIKKKNVKIVYEYPTLPWRDETRVIAKGVVRRIFDCIDFLLYKSLDRIPDCITYVGSYSGGDKRYFRLHNCGNHQFYKCNCIKPKANDINMIAVAHTASSLGYDYVIKAMSEYYRVPQKREVFFHIVGDTSRTPELEAMTAEYRLHKYVLFHGYQTGESLDALFQMADIGINKILIEDERFRKTGFATLKTVEYTFRGLPQVSGAGFAIEGDKVDIPDFLCVLDHNEFSIDKIIEFYNRVNTNPNRIREYAEEHMSWNTDFAALFTKLGETQ